MIKKSTLLHLRFPFSFYLLPVFLLACAIAGQETHAYPTILAFFILHFLVYPASNGYNSYFDKDEKSIGGLKNPPKVSSELYYVSLLMDLLGILLSLLIGIEFTVMIFIYGMISKAYSHPSIRLKKYPMMGWLAAGIFQGYFTYLMCFIAITDSRIMETWNEETQIPGLLASLLLLGSYPMTQVYQHEEDARRGDMTMSRLLGIKGTFHFTGIVFLLATVGFVHYFFQYDSTIVAMMFPIALGPVLIFFSGWYLKVRKNVDEANFERTMQLNFLSSALLNAFFIYLWIS